MLDCCCRGEKFCLVFTSHLEYDQREWFQHKISLGAKTTFCKPKAKTDVKSIDHMVATIWQILQKRWLPRWRIIGVSVYRILASKTFGGKPKALMDLRRIDRLIDQDVSNSLSEKGWTKFFDWYHSHKPQQRPTGELWWICIDQFQYFRIKFVFIIESNVDRAVVSLKFSQILKAYFEQHVAQQAEPGR